MKYNLTLNKRTFEIIESGYTLAKQLADSNYELPVIISFQELPHSKEHTQHWLNHLSHFGAIQYEAVNNQTFRLLEISPFELWVTL
ncbi:Uncharacterised protein [Escherichia coli]|uniref:hypothetical protein n=1 Tax=Escherichia coli TaxID=562 RepID=UPI000DFA8DA7|nr:hypothetical protein [Escherichia coli]EFG9130041.1 hypothetical protein [Escherichia coli]STL20398.1 Uncharacterised protein [Escherichia coli]HAH8857556.1 hypothetical protein [Escherichia coli]